MKEVVNALYQEARNELSTMKKSEMKLSDRIKYEVALAKLSAMKKIIDKFNF